MNPKAIVINPADNVAVSLVDIKAGEEIALPDGGSLTAEEDIPFSHKVALRDIAPGEYVVKYGEVIGQAREAIRRGSWIHTHNLAVED